eukprot:2396330-Rhodomonas_salina.1
MEHMLRLGGWQAMSDDEEELRWWKEGVGEEDWREGEEEEEEKVEWKGKEGGHVVFRGAAIDEFCFLRSLVEPARTDTCHKNNGSNQHRSSVFVRLALLDVSSAYRY